MTRFNKNLITLLTGAAFFLGTTSCEVINQEPESVFTQDTFWKKEGDATAALMATYADVKWLAASQGDWRTPVFMFVMGDARADMLKKGWGADCCFPSLVTMTNQVITPDNEYANWARFYQLINRVNGVIRFTPEVTQKDKTFTEAESKSLLGEAYFLRALAYFYVARWWKDAPLILEPVTDAKQDLAVRKNSQAELFNQVEQDLKQALAEGYLGATTGGTPNGRATKGAAYAMLTDLYLWQGRYAEAADAAQKAMNSGNYSLAANWWDNFYKGNTPESIFEVQFTGSNGDFSNLSWMSNWENGHIQLWEKSQVFTDLVQASGDYEEAGKQDYTYTGRGYHGYGQKYWNWADTRMWKYLGKDDTNVKSALQDDTNWIIYRLADVMLMRAEALNRASGGNSQEAIDLVNEVRARAGVPAKTVNLGNMFEVEDVIMDERAVELSFEGKRWFDLIRASKGRPNYLVDKVVERYDDDAKEAVRARIQNPESWYMPIFRRELQLNPNLEQNPFYQ